MIKVSAFERGRFNSLKISMYFSIATAMIKLLWRGLFHRFFQRGIVSLHDLILGGEDIYSYVQEANTIIIKAIMMLCFQKLG